jgi:hypothetical protein
MRRIRIESNLGRFLSNGGVSESDEVGCASTGEGVGDVGRGFLFVWVVVGVVSNSLLLALFCGGLLVGVAK